jgi:hypothetical protein
LQSSIYSCVFHRFCAIKPLDKALSCQHNMTSELCGFFSVLLIALRLEANDLPPSK